MMSLFHNSSTWIVFLDIDIGDSMDLSIPRLHECIQRSDIEGVKQYIEDVNYLNCYGESALMHAIEREDLPIIKILLAAKADVNINTPYGGTALKSALNTLFTDEKHREEILELLIAHHIKPIHHLLYHYARQCNLKGMLYCLMNGVHVSEKDLWDETALSKVIKSTAPNKEEAIKMLLRWGASLTEEGAFIVEGGAILSRLKPGTRERVEKYPAHINHQIKCFLNDFELETCFIEKILFFRLWGQRFKAVYYLVSEQLIIGDVLSAQQKQSLKVYEKAIALVGSYKTQWEKQSASVGREIIARLPYELKEMIYKPILKSLHDELSTHFKEMIASQGSEYANDAEKIVALFMPYATHNRDWRRLFAPENNEAALAYSVLRC